jgi:hypothetical protein
MSRRLLNFLTVLSLLLCVAVCALWAGTSGRRPTWVVSSGPRRAVLVRSGGGELHVGRQSVESLGAVTVPGVTFSLTEPGSIGYDTPGSKGSLANGWYGPQAGTWSAGSTTVRLHADLFRLRHARLRLSYALLALATAVLPAARLAGRAWRQSRSAGGDAHPRCATCGYDLIPSPKRVIAILPDEPPQQPTPPQ